MMTVSGSERCTTETLSASSTAESGLPSSIRSGARSFIRSRKLGVTNSGVSTERSCTNESVDSALIVLAIIWTTPGAVACRLMAVMSTESGTLMRSAANTSVSQAIWCPSGSPST